MADEITNDNPVVETPPADTPPVVDEPATTPDEPLIEEVPEVPTETADEETVQEDDKPEVPEEKPVSRREQKRVRDLLGKYPQLGNQTAPPARDGRLDYGEALDADPEVIKQLEADRQREGQMQYNAGLEQAKALQFHTRLEIDAPKIESKYPRLNPESPDFDAAAADDINSLYLALTGYNEQTGMVQNPNLRYADFVETQIGLSERLASRRVVESTKNIAKQTAATGLRPDGSSAKRMDLNKDPHAMTDEELKAVIAQSIPQQ